MTPATPVRALGTRTDQGVRLVRDGGPDHGDGSEQRVLEIIRNAGDVGSTTDELIVSATTPAERHHLHPARANVLRALDLPAGARVLEIGAGCGAVTRVLGERCALVDALEPVPARAAAAAERTRDLDAVEVIVGTVADVPAEPTYDLVVALDAPGPAGGGTEDDALSPALLARARELLVDGGTLVVAVGNRLRVDHLIGGGDPDDDGTARTVTRTQLESLLRDVGLDPRPLIAFPDHTVARAVLDRMPRGAESLTYRLPRLVSPDRSEPHRSFADERRVWQRLVDSDVAFDFGNSLVVLAAKGTPAARLWPEGRLATSYSTDRRPALSTRTVVEHGPDGVRFVRAGLTGGEHRVGTVELRGSTVGYEPGRDLLEVLADGGPDAAADLLPRWAALVHAACDGGGPAPVDLVPHNLLVDGSELRVVGTDLVDSAAGADVVLRRGVLGLAERVTRMAPPARWQPARTVGEVMTSFGALVGLPADGSWIADAVRDEAEAAIVLRPGPPTGSTLRQWRERLLTELAAIPELPLAGRTEGETLRETQRRTAARLDEAQARVSELEAALARVSSDLETARASLSKTRAEATELRARSLGARARRAGGTLLPSGSERRRRVGAALPPGSVRRRVLERLLGR